MVWVMQLSKPANHCKQWGGVKPSYVSGQFQFSNPLKIRHPSHANYMDIPISDVLARCGVFHNPCHGGVLQRHINQHFELLRFK